MAIAVTMVVAMASSVRAGAADDDAQERSRLIATADFNGDGIADVAEVTLPDGTQSGSAFVTILLGQRNGSFKPMPRRALPCSDPRSIVAGDFNGDIRADLLVACGDGAIIELLGDGRGGLRPAGEVAHEDSVVSITIGDFNRDGILDIAVSDFGSNSVIILLGSGKGSFRYGWSFALPMRGTTYYLAAADFNGDGVSDLAITSDEEGTFVVMLGNGNGTFTYAPALSHLRDPNSYCPT